MRLTFDSLQELLAFVEKVNLGSVRILPPLPKRDTYTRGFVAEKIAHMAYTGDFGTGSSKIMAIKHFRDWTSCSLREAKEAIERTSIFHTHTTP